MVRHTVLQIARPLPAGLSTERCRAPARWNDAPPHSQIRVERDSAEGGVVTRGRHRGCMKAAFEPLMENSRPARIANGALKWQSMAVHKRTPLRIRANAEIGSNQPLFTLASY